MFNTDILSLVASPLIKEGDMRDRDVTDLVKRGYVDDECMPIEKCVCGAEFKGWDWTISIYRDRANKCPACGRKLYFRQSVSVFEVVDTPQERGSSS